MDGLLNKYRWHCCVVYIDDVLVVFSYFQRSFEKHEAVLECVSAARAMVKPSKCVYAAKEIDYLENIISRNGLLPDPEKLEAVEKFPVLELVTDLKSFVRLCSYFRR